MAEKRPSTQTTLQLSIEGGHKADQALLMYGTKASLAAELEMSRTTITNFFARRSVEQAKFKKICRELKLKVEEVIEAAVEVDRGIEELVKKLRVAIQPSIKEDCGTMQVLDMGQPIELTGDRGIYTNVNILEKLTRLRSEREVLQNCEIEEFGRLGLGRTIGKPIPGLEAVQMHKRLMVLGKPGAGKTTFLKYLAMQCVTGRFAADSVPFFVTLKDFAEAPEQPSLVKYLVKSLPKGWAIETIEQLLAAGRAIVLLDGLDEVREEDTRRVIREVRSTVNGARESQFVMTCRIAAKEYLFAQFTEVEVADFDDQQIKMFVENWFRSKNDLSKAERFMARLKDDEAIRELAASPLLLTLLCLVFGEEGDFPSNRSDLYGEGVKVLLKKWDAKRNIQRDDQYKKLDVQRREDLLSYVALQTFREKEYFVKQRRMEGYIADFISNLRDVDPDPESLRMDSEIVLKSIQAQHGLLVERARGIYSFSHLTFQEYFTAREIVFTNDIEHLVLQIHQPRWREVFLLTAGMMRNADELLLMMKRHIDLSVKDDPKLQEFLQWVDRKTHSVKAEAKSVVVRTYYFDRALDLNRTLALASALDDRALDDHALDRALDLDLDLDHALDRAVALDRFHDRTFARLHTLVFTLTAQRSEFQCQFKQLSDRLPNQSQKNLKQWWSTYGKQWTEDLRQIMITHRDIGHDWQFTNKQKQCIQQYYDANLLLVQCLNSNCYVSRHVRQSIEDALLLPYEKLKIENVE